MDAQSASLYDSSIPRSLARVAARGTVISLVGLVIYRGLNYLLEVIVARKVGANAYGVFVQALVVVNLVGVLALLGLNSGARRYVARFRALGDRTSERLLTQELLLVVVVWGTLLAMAVYGLSDSITTLLNGGDSANEMNKLLRALTPVITLSPLVLVLSAVAEGQASPRCPLQGGLVPVKRSNSRSAKRSVIPAT